MTYYLCSLDENWWKIVRTIWVVPESLFIWSYQKISTLEVYWLILFFQSRLIQLLCFQTLVDFMLLVPKFEHCSLLILLLLNLSLHEHFIVVIQYFVDFQILFSLLGNVLLSAIHLWLECIANCWLHFKFFAHHFNFLAFWILRGKPSCHRHLRQFFRLLLLLFLSNIKSKH